MTEMTPDELLVQLETGRDDLIVLDIRNEDAYAEWHIPGSLNIPIIDRLKTAPDAVEGALSELPTDSEVVTVCRAGVASQTATELLHARGIEANTLIDGMNGWSRVHQSAAIDAHLGGVLVQVARPGKGCLSHVLISNGKAAVFDPSQYIGEYREILHRYDAELVATFDTHAHADHVSGGRELADHSSVPYYLHAADAERVIAEPVVDGDSVRIGNVRVDVLHTPGHSPGSVTYAIENAALLTGDTLFHDGVGRVELGVAAGFERATAVDNAVTLYHSLERIHERNENPLILPSHDSGAPMAPVAARLNDLEHLDADLRGDRCDFVESVVSDVPEHPENFERIKRLNMGLEHLDGTDPSALEHGPNRCAAR